MEQQLGITYLNNKPWHEITRDERYFCALLFENIKKNVPFFISELQKLLPALHLDHTEEWECGFEVCFFRDYEYYFQKIYQNLKSDDSYSPKRTFDLCLFSESTIIIIEAKAHESFKNAQLTDIDKDKDRITSLLSKCGFKTPKILTLSLTRDGYSSELLNRFDGNIYWSWIANIYGNKFNRPNELKKQ